MGHIGIPYRWLRCNGYGNLVEKCTIDLNKNVQINNSKYTIVYERGGNSINNLSKTMDS